MVALVKLVNMLLGTGSLLRIGSCQPTCGGETRQDYCAAHPTTVCGTDSSAARNLPANKRLPEITFNSTHLQKPENLVRRLRLGDGSS